MRRFFSFSHKWPECHAPWPSSFQVNGYRDRLRGCVARLYGLSRRHAPGRWQNCRLNSARLCDLPPTLSRDHWQNFRTVLSSTTLMATIDWVVRHDLHLMSSHRKVCVQLGRRGAGFLLRGFRPRPTGCAKVPEQASVASLSFFRERLERIKLGRRRPSRTAGVVELSAEEFLKPGYRPRFRQELRTWRQHSSCKLVVAAHDNDARLRFLLACHPGKINPIK